MYVETYQVSNGRCRLLKINKKNVKNSHFRIIVIIFPLLHTYITTDMNQFPTTSSQIIQLQPTKERTPRKRNTTGQLGIVDIAYSSRDEMINSFSPKTNQQNCSDAHTIAETIFNHEYL